MKNKLNKIIFIIIFSALCLLISSSATKATISMNGTTFYTRSDIAWRGHYISVSGDWYYCRNHGYSLTGYLPSNDSTLSWGSSWSEAYRSEEVAEEWAIKNVVHRAEEHGWSFNSNTARLSNYLRALTLEKGPWQEVTTTEERALYAFSCGYSDNTTPPNAHSLYPENNPEPYILYGNPSEIVQKSVWDYMSRHPEAQFQGEDGCRSDGSTEINLAAIWYTNVWLPSNKVNVMSNDKAAVAKVSGSNYIVGPFAIAYNEATIGRVVFSEQIGHKITDQNGTPIAGAQVTDANGVPMAEIPNGQNFYIKFPYSETMTELNVDIDIKSIKDVYARKQDIKSTAHNFRYKIDVEISGTDRWKHSSNCIVSPGAYSNDDYFCPFCDKTHVTWYRAKATGHSEYVGKASQKYQNMIKIDGSIIYEYPHIHLSTPLGPDKPEPEPGPGPNPPDEEHPPIVEMEVAGYVWEDGEQGKSQSIDGKLGGNDKRLDGIEVRLYKSDGTLAEVHGENGKNKTNPTITDANGYYSFKGVNPIYKYYVVFTYDGMLYTNTYGAGVPEYNTQAWDNSSKGSELVSERDALNTKFVTISSYPASYRTSAIFGGGYLTNGYNKIFDVNDSRITTYKNRVKEQLRSYLSSHDRINGDSDYISNIYNPIINSSSDQTEAKQVLQYLWDSRINAYAGNESEQDGKTTRAGGKYYPVYDKFALVDNNGNRVTATNSTATFDGYRIIYNGQLHINLGVIRRPTTDLQLDEDLYKTVVSINGQDETYEYGTFSSKGVKVNSADAMLTQNVATDDYDYKVHNQTLSSELSGTAAYPKDYAPIQMYITYRINITNNSSIPTGVNEVATYIDSRYFSYSDSYTTTGGMNIKGIEGTYLYPDSDTSYAERNLTDYNSNSFGLKVNTNSRYGTGSETGKFMGTDLYITFDNDVILEQNQMIALYITYRLGENSTKDAKFNCTHNSPQPGGGNHAYALLQDLFRNTDNKKVYVYTRAEINAYSTFFKKNEDPSGTQSKYGSYYRYSTDLRRGYAYRAAGLFDALSVPGNLDQGQVDRYDQNKEKSEDDWDKASTFVIMDAGIRNIKGSVWETVGQQAHYWTETSEYPKFNSNYGAQDITVELVEIKNGTEYVRARTTTDNNGAYEFKEYIPGLYTIRFLYGDSAEYDTQQYSRYTTYTLNEVVHKSPYNGQFYQSAKANPKTNDNQYWYAVEEGDRYSDAYDEATIRKAVNDSLPTYIYSDEVRLMKHPTDYMVYAYTSLLDLEVEKAVTNTTAQKPGYTITNVDFALTPRTETKLSINKEVTHLKLILQNGTVQFDADTSTIREQGVPSVVQAAQGNDITISMSSELVNGATLEITYTITVTNESLEDTVTYYKDSTGNILALGFYKEDPTKITYFEEGSMRTYNNNGGFQRNTDTKWVSKTVSGTTAMKAYDANKTERIETTTSPTVIADFISNNLTFSKTSYTGSPINDTWDLYTGEKRDMEYKYYRQDQTDTELALKPQDVLEMTEESQDVYDSNVIVFANERNPLVTTPLKHGESVTDNIILSKVISVNDDSTDTKSYINKLRILSINNTVSKQQDLGDTPVTDTSEHVVISDPTGIGNTYLGILLALVVTAIIGTGIVFIKKYAIKK